MPVIRVSQAGGGGEGEDIGGAAGGLRGSAPSAPATDAGTRELNRVSNNMRLAEHLGQFVAGQVSTQFQNENLADMLKGRNMIMISASWG